MPRWSVTRFAVSILLSALAWAVVAALCVAVGSDGTVGFPANRDVFAIRREVVLVASLVGAALAAAGVTYQALLNNPLADPYLLGVSSGAMLAGYVWLLPVFAGIHALLPVGQQVTSFCGALLAVAAVLAIAGRRGRLEPVTVVLVGVIINAVCGAGLLLINELTRSPAIAGGEITFLVGGLQANLRRWQIATAACVIAAGWAVLAMISGVLNVGAMDDAEAESLGVRVNRLRWVGLAAASLVTASAVAISGPIGFVGLICPHLARLFVGSDVRRLLPIATALGAILLVVADAAARWLASQGKIGSYLPVGIITSMLGGPFFLVLLLTRRK